MASNPTPARPPSAREELAWTLRKIYDLDLTTTSGGNLSLRDDDGRIWITPAKIDKGQLRPEQIACVAERAGDRASETRSDPPASSELPFHRAIYAARADLRAIVHVHAVSLVAFSVVRQVPDTRISAHCHALCGSVGFAPYALPASVELGERIAATFAEGYDCVVLENHGVVLGGTTLRRAFERLEALDLCARTILRARTVGHEQILSPEDLACGSLLGGADSTAAILRSESAPSQEPALRRSLCEIARRAYAKRLMTSTQGTLSSRLSQDVFLLTPRAIPLDRLEPSDLVRVGFGASPEDALDSEEALHAALYRRHPEVGAIVHGYGEHSSGFGVAGLDVSARTIPESYLLVREPARVSYRESRRDPASIASILCPDNPVALIQNDGALALGTNLLDAFDRLEVLEATAAAGIASRPLGELSPMNDDQVAELRRSFFPKGGF